MEPLQVLHDRFLTSLGNIWERILNFIPVFLGALIVLVIGIVISNLLGRLAGRLVALTRIDRITERGELKDDMKNFGIEWSFSWLAEWIVKWFFYIVTIVTVVDILNVEQLSVFLERLVLYLPNVLVAIVIMVVGLLAGQLLKNIVGRALRGFAITERLASFLGSLAKWAIFIFALMAALVQLGVAAELIQILFTGFIFMLAIAAGLSFGLGGREHASRVLDRLVEEISAEKR